MPLQELILEWEENNMKRYWTNIKEKANALKGDGCTSSPDFFYRKCCDEHDVHYRTGETIDGFPISRLEADNRLFECMKKQGKTPIIGRFIIPCFYWIGVRLFGGDAWKGW